MRKSVRLLAAIANLPPHEAEAAMSFVDDLLRASTATIPAVAAGPAQADRLSPPPVARPAPAADHVGPAPAARADVVVRLLGKFEVQVGDTPVQVWGGARIRTVAHYLLLHDRPVRREVLMDLLWPGHTYRSARSNLNVCLYGLRRALGTSAGRDCVVYRDGCYGLNQELDWSLDSVRFEKATNRARGAAARGDVDTAIHQFHVAVDTYAGPLLEGESPMEWFGDIRDALAERFVQALQQLAELDLSVGDVAGAELAACRLLREDPCRESAHRLLMVCYARQHQLDRVARQYRRCGVTLRDELAIAPSTETARLYQELTR